jgi:hypothetical protein
LSYHIKNKNKTAKKSSSRFLQRSAAPSASASATKKQKSLADWDDDATLHSLRASGAFKVQASSAGAAKKTSEISRAVPSVSHPCERTRRRGNGPITTAAVVLATPPAQRINAV